MADRQRPFIVYWSFGIQVRIASGMEKGAVVRKRGFPNLTVIV